MPTCLWRVQMKCRHLRSKQTRVFLKNRFVAEQKRDLDLYHIFSQKFPKFQERICTLPETHSSPLKIGHPKRKLVFQPSIFRGYVSFREGNLLQNLDPKSGFLLKATNLLPTFNEKELPPKLQGCICVYAVY